MAKRNIVQKRQQKALKHKKKKQAQHAHKKFSTRHTGSLPKLSNILMKFATPLLGDNKDKASVEGTIGMVIMCWNIGTVEYQAAQKMRDELINTFMAKLDEDLMEELEKEFDLLIAAKRAFFPDDPRIVVGYDLSWNMMGDYQLQVQSIRIPEEERLNPYDKEHSAFGLSAKTQQNIAELRTPATEEQAPILELIKQGSKLLLDEGTLILSEKTPVACDLWLEAWEKVKDIYKDTHSINSIKAFAGMRLSDWCGELEMHLYDAGKEDPVYFNKRIQYCREFCREFPESDDQLIHNMIRGEAETLFFSGQFEQGEAVFKQLIERFPDNTRGYIGWGDMYSGNYSDLPENPEKAEKLYQIPIDRQLEDAGDAQDRLDDLLTMKEDSSRLVTIKADVV